METYNSSNNTATWTLANAAGCDSVVLLDLTIINTDSTLIQEFSCDEFVWGGDVYTQSGVYTNTYTNIAGCDSVVILDLTISENNLIFDLQTHCDSYFWNGETYNQSGSYTYVSTNELGCLETNIFY